MTSSHRGSGDIRRHEQGSLRLDHISVLQLIASRHLHARVRTSRWSISDRALLTTASPLREIYYAASLANTAEVGTEFPHRLGFPDDKDAI